MANKNILLIEPGYKNKYPPLGLMKLAAYHGEFGKKDNVKFIKGTTDQSVLKIHWDRIYITTLFSFEWNEISKSIDYALKIAMGDTSKVFVGGIAASLMNERFLAQKKWSGIRFISGLLSKSPAESLQLDDFAEEMYSDDHDGTPIEDLTPDYSILRHIENDYIYPVRDAYFGYASRGCVRKCHFCGVPKLEGAQRPGQSLTKLISEVDKRYGVKKDLMLMDNNVVAAPNYKEIIAEIIDLGFYKDAKLSRPNKPSVKRRVDFNQGVDARILCKDIMYLREMSKIAISPLRIAFDHIGVKKPYETAVRMSHDVGINTLSNYMLYNFKDTPEDLYQRMRINISLNEELGIRIFSFPMRYQPTDLPNRSHISDKWNKYFLRSMQIILQATHGIVSGNPPFFKKAFGDGQEEFLDLLLRPHDFLFNRNWFEEHGGQEKFFDFLNVYKKLSEDNKKQLSILLSSTERRNYAGLIGQSDDSNINKILAFYLPLNDEQNRFIWDRMKIIKDQNKISKDVIPQDQLVEDAGLKISSLSGSEF